MGEGDGTYRVLACRLSVCIVLTQLRSCSSAHKHEGNLDKRDKERRIEKHQNEPKVSEDYADESERDAMCGSIKSHRD